MSETRKKIVVMRIFFGTRPDAKLDYWNAFENVSTECKDIPGAGFGFFFISDNANSFVIGTAVINTHKSAKAHADVSKNSTRMNVIWQHRFDAEIVCLVSRCKIQVVL